MISIRSVEPRDLDAFIVLCGEHAAFERAAYDPTGKPEKLRQLLFAREPALIGKVAVSEDALVGYATASAEVSTWAAARFVHMDCLFVRAGCRGQGVGAMLMAAIMEEAARLGIDQLQWQTPAWNTDADRFYRRAGALASEKLRYTLDIKDSPIRLAGLS